VYGYFIKQVGVEQVIKSLKGDALDDEMVIEQAVARVLKKAI